MNSEDDGRPNLRIAVVGATGNVGCRVVEALSASAAIKEVIGISRRPGLDQPKRWVAADIAKDDLEALFHEVNVVVQLAWRFQPTHNPVITWHNNVLGTIRVLTAAAKAGVGTVVYASSIGAYSPASDDRPVDEQWPTHGWPNAAYTREKAYLERVLDSFERDHPEMRIVRLRPGFVFQRQAAVEQWQLFAGALLPRKLVRPWAAPFVPRIPGLRLQVVHAVDLAEAFRLSVLNPVRGAFNIAAAPVIDTDALAQQLGSRTIPMPEPLLRGAVSAAWHLRAIPTSPHLLEAVLRLPVMDTGRAAAELGWVPRYTAHDALADLIAGLREGGRADTPPLRGAPTGSERP